MRTGRLGSFAFSFQNQLEIVAFGDGQSAPETCDVICQQSRHGAGAAPPAGDLERCDPTQCAAYEGVGRNREQSQSERIGIQVASSQ